MNFNTLIKNLEKLEREALSYGYKSDASNYAFKIYTLLFLKQIAKGKKKHKLSKWSIFLGEYLKKGKSAKEAGEDWKNKK